MRHCLPLASIAAASAGRRIKSLSPAYPEQNRDHQRNQQTCRNRKVETESFAHNIDIARQVPKWKSGKPGPCKTGDQQGYAGNDHETLHMSIHLHYWITASMSDSCMDTGEFSMRNQEPRQEQEAGKPIEPGYPPREPITPPSEPLVPPSEPHVPPPEPVTPPPEPLAPSSAPVAQQGSNDAEA